MIDLTVSKYSDTYVMFFTNQWWSYFENDLITSNPFLFEVSESVDDSNEHLIGFKISDTLN